MGVQEDWNKTMSSNGSFYSELRVTRNYINDRDRIRCRFRGFVEPHSFNTFNNVSPGGF